LPADHVAHWYGVPTSRRAATQQAKVWRLTSASHPFSPFSLAGSLEARAEDFPAQSDRRLLRQRGAGATTPLSGISRRARRHACAGWQSLGHLERITIGHKQAAIASGWFLDVRPLPLCARCMLRVALLRRFPHAVMRAPLLSLAAALQRSPPYAAAAWRHTAEWPALCPFVCDCSMHPACCALSRQYNTLRRSGDNRRPSAARRVSRLATS
jgi:hypothetical protein